jgi:hypothetical protein
VKPAWLDPLIKMSDRLAASIELGSAFVSASPTDRAAVAAGWGFGVDWEYPSPWRLACTKGEQGSPQQRIVATLVLNGLESRNDSREELLVFCVAYNAGALAGLDADALLSTVARSLPDRAARALRDFVGRSPRDKALEAFLLVKQPNAHGEIEIRPTW